MSIGWVSRSGSVKSKTFSFPLEVYPFHEPPRCLATIRTNGCNLIWHVAANRILQLYVSEFQIARSECLTWSLRAAASWRWFTTHGHGLCCPFDVRRKVPPHKPFPLICAAMSMSGRVGRCYRPTSLV